MLEHLLGGRSPVVMPREHGHEEVGKGLSLFLMDKILVSQYFLYRPKAETFDPPQVGLAVEVLARVLAREGQVGGHSTQELHHLSQVVIVLVVGLPFARFKEEVSGHHFKDCAGKTPDISRRVVVCANDDLGGPILSSLDLRGKVVIGPTAIAHVTDLDLDIVANPGSSLKFLIFLLLSLFLFLIAIQKIINLNVLGFSTDALGI